MARVQLVDSSAGVRSDRFVMTPDEPFRTDPHSVTVIPTPEPYWTPQVKVADFSSEFGGFVPKRLKLKCEGTRYMCVCVCERV